MSKEIEIRLDDLYTPVSFGGGGGGDGGGGRGRATYGACIAAATQAGAELGARGGTKGRIAGAAIGGAVGVVGCGAVGRAFSGPSYAEMSNARARFYTPPPNVSEPTSGPR